MAIKVKALEMGFYDGRRYRAGESFVLLPGHKPGKWMETMGEVDPPKVKEPKAKKESVKAPETFSEISKSAPKAPEGLI